MSDSQTKVDETTTQNESTEETTTQPVDGTTQKTDQVEDEVVTLPKKEAETLKKKADDFDGLVEKRRLEKLALKERAQVDADPDEVKRIAREQAEAVLAEREQKQNLASYQTNLQSAYRELKSEYKFLDSDEAMAAIGKYFQDGGALDKESLRISLEIAAEKAFPVEFHKAREAVVKAKVLAEVSQIGAGTMGTGPSKPAGTTYVPTDEDKRIADRFFGGNMDRYLKASKKV